MSIKSHSLPKIPKTHLIIAGGIIAAASILFSSPNNVQAKVTILDLSELGKNRVDNNQFTTPLESKKTENEVTPSPFPLLSADKVSVKKYSDEIIEDIDFSNIADSYSKVITGNDLLLSPDSPSTSMVKWEEVSVRSGDTLSTIFARLGLPITSMHNALKSDKEANSFTKLRVGQKIYFDIENNEGQKNLVAMELRPSILETVRIERDDEGFKFAKNVIEPEIRHKVASGTVNTSFAMAARNAGLGRSTVSQLSSVFGYDIDFSRHVRKGDRFEVLVEEKHVDGKALGYGNILAARFENRGKTYTAVRHTNKDGSISYYREDGSSMERAFIRSPVDSARISSRFNPNRRHPILNRIRPHNGVDYAAPTGTPIKAAGDGQVVHLGNKGGYGRTVVIKHGNSYQTLYAHMHRYSNGLKRGSQVKKGQVIGYVGMSGLATGPHLHYEFLVNGRHVDPLKVKLPTADPIPKSELTKFLIMSKQLMANLDGNESGNIQLAMIDD